MSHAHAHPNEHATSVPADYDERLTNQREELKALGNCWREFMRHFSGWAGLTAVVIVAALRIAAGGFSWIDPVILVVVLVLVQPFVEWMIHTYLLHLKPFKVAGRSIDLYTARAHRRHHKDPSSLDRTLLHRGEFLGSMFLIAITAAPIFAASASVVSDAPFTQLYLSSLLVAYIGLWRYEWVHFLIHTPYVPRTRYYRSVWRSHRLHHFKHEDYWMGITGTLADKTLGTFPDQGDVEKSPTARTLGVDA